MIFGTLVNKISQFHYNVKVLNDNETISKDYEGFFNDIYKASASLVQRGMPYILRNPDYNILSANGTTSVTPSEGSDYEVVSNWYLINGGGSNSYSVTPTAYTEVPFSPTGSNYYLNFNVDALTNLLYLYNLNYSTSGNFNSLGKFSGQKVTFSTIIRNNATTSPQISFSADVGGIEEKETPGIFLQPESYNLIAETMELPTLMDTTLAGQNTQFRFNIKDLNGGTADFDVYYIKAEMSNLATPLNIDHTLEQLIVDNLS